MSTKTTNFETNSPKRQPHAKGLKSSAKSTRSPSTSLTTVEAEPGMLVSKDFYDPLIQYDNLLKQTEANLSDLIHSMRQDQANSIRGSLSKP